MTSYLILILIAQVLIGWKIFFPRYRIILVSPIYRNTETKELGCWANLSMKIPFVPYPGLVLHARDGGIYKISSVEWDRSARIFRCDVFYDTPIYTDNEGYEHIKKNIVDWKWTVREVPPGHILKNWKEE
ncbi:MAG: hypothetical protein HYS17_08435 [Micavibrio aeruginosavorus]|uniref:Uncharacterized protein n=1 Tax=Micavibrio aeruginosavorus TaxID=349221 RepID=A0A7T5R157_9BACT|nr:MAG: hypothetical protein HYS17_08435 [Micavibrio aeruginosavorus]